MTSRSKRLAIEVNSAARFLPHYAPPAFPITLDGSVLGARRLGLPHRVCEGAGQKRRAEAEPSMHSSRPARLSVCSLCPGHSGPGRSTVSTR
ncbi:MAG: hypothetical protein QOH67_3460 [Hyphomicrobiales bacterium]|nr:hypothetical protein [Hyphomicrobiales bacterium]